MRTFRPPRHLRNPHLQSLLTSFRGRKLYVLPRARGLLATSQNWLLDCGNGVRLQAQVSRRARGAPLAILLHGWEGSSDSVYLLSAAAQLHTHGFTVARLNLRDHGLTQHLNAGLFHAGRLNEVVSAIRALVQRLDATRVCLGGFSLGGNFALRAALRAPAAGVELAQVVAISPPIDPHHSMHALETGWRGYHDYFMKKWHRSLRRKHAYFPDRYDIVAIERLTSLRELSDYFIERYTPYRDLDSYFSIYDLTGGKLQGLRCPTLILSADDDPVIPAVDLERVRHHPMLTIQRSRFGGHCGFIERFGAPSFADGLMLGTFAAAV